MYIFKYLGISFLLNQDISQFITEIYNIIVVVLICNSVKIIQYFMTRRLNDNILLFFYNDFEEISRHFIKINLLHKINILF